MATALCPGLDEHALSPRQRSEPVMTNRSTHQLVVVPHALSDARVIQVKCDNGVYRRRETPCALPYAANHHLLPNELLPCEWEIDDRAWLRWQPVAGETRRWMYDRGDPMANEAALREALPALYRSFGEALDSP
ncbi:MAG: hypothetical protein ACOX6M_04930 [Armatimonadota bacterium]